LASAADHLNRAVAMYEAQGDPSSATIPERYLAFLSLAAGKPAEARRPVLEVLAFFRSTRAAPDVLGLHRMVGAIAMRGGGGAATGRRQGRRRAPPRPRPGGGKGGLGPPSGRGPGGCPRSSAAPCREGNDPGAPISTAPPRPTRPR